MEQELKLRLMDRKDYELLERKLGVAERETDQVNSYLDTPDGALARLQIMARIRDEDGSRRFTVKWGADHGGGYFQAEEEEADLRARSPEDAVESGEAALTLAYLCPPARTLDLSRLRILGSMRNRRKRFHVDGFELELDHSEYDDGNEDFEVELETSRPDDAWKLVSRLLEESDAQAEPQTLTKYQRFLNHAAKNASVSRRSRPGRHEL